MLWLPFKGMIIFLIMVNYVAVAQPNYVDSGKSCFAIWNESTMFHYSYLRILNSFALSYCLLICRQHFISINSISRILQVCSLSILKNWCYQLLDHFFAYGNSCGVILKYGKSLLYISRIYFMVTIVHIETWQLCSVQSTSKTLWISCWHFNPKLLNSGHLPVIG